MKRILVPAGILIIILAAGWIINGQKLNFSSVKMVQAQEVDDSGEKPHKEIVIAVEQVINDETKRGQVRLVFEDAPEIPTSRPNAFGLFLGRTSDQITLGTGSIEVSADIEIINDEAPVKNVKVSHDGEEVTFLVNNQTRYLRDTTKRPEITPELIELGEVTIPGSVTLGGLEEIGTDAVLRVWGTHQKGSLVADLVVYEIVE